MTKKNWSARTRDDLIIEVWEHLDCESVGADELQGIQSALLERFGAGALTSPAAIARVVADEGAVLRHPEVFECDREWREAVLKSLSFGDSLDFSTAPRAFESVVRIEEERLRLSDNPEGLRDLRDVVTALKTELILNSRSQIIAEAQRTLLDEVAQWLTVWLQSPELFSDWLDLRRRSPEFRTKFSDA